MTPEMKAEWIKRLREPERKQTSKFLHHSEGQCCLGVLCELLAETHPDEVVVTHLSNSTRSYNGSTTTLSESIQELTKLSAMGRIPGLRDKVNWDIDLAELNDRGFTFPQIADVIEYFF